MFDVAEKIAARVARVAGLNHKKMQMSPQHAQELLLDIVRFAVESETNYKDNPDLLRADYNRNLGDRTERFVAAYLNGRINGEARTAYRKATEKGLDPTVALQLQLDMSEEEAQETVKLIASMEESEDSSTEEKAEDNDNLLSDLEDGWDQGVSTPDAVGDVREGAIPEQADRSSLPA